MCSENTSSPLPDRLASSCKYPGKPDGIKIVPLSEVATKDDFFNIKKVSAADLLDAHRIPFQLMGGKPENVGSVGG